MKNTVQVKFDQQFERYFYSKIIVTIIPRDLITNLVFVLFLSFFANQKQESGFQQVVGLVMRNISIFWL